MAHCRLGAFLRTQVRERNASCLSTESKCLWGGAAGIGSDAKGLSNKLLLGLELNYVFWTFIHSLTYSTSVYEALTVCGVVLGVRDVMPSDTVSPSHLPGACSLVGKQQRDTGYSIVVEEAPILSSLSSGKWEKKSRLSTWFIKQVVHQQ